MGNIHHRIGQILIHLNVITHHQVLEARRIQMCNPSRRLGEIMIELGHITQFDLDRALSLQRDMMMGVDTA